MQNRLTWFDWTLIVVAIVLVLHFPALVGMWEYAGSYDSALDQMGGAP